MSNTFIDFRIQEVLHIYKENIKDKTFSLYLRLMLYGDYLEDYEVVYKQLGCEFMNAPEDLQKRSCIAILDEETNMDHYLPQMQRIEDLIRNGMEISNADKKIIKSAYRQLCGVRSAIQGARHCGTNLFFTKNKKIIKLYYIFKNNAFTLYPILKTEKFLNLREIFEEKMNAMEYL